MSILHDVGLSVDLAKPGVYAGDGTTELVTNGAFISDLAGWTQDTDSGNATIARDATLAALKLTTNVGGDVEGSCHQQINVTGGAGYHLTFDSMMSDIFATMQGRFAIYDNTNAAWIIPTRNSWCITPGSSGSPNWQTASIYFNTPATCSSIQLYLYQNIDSDNGQTTDCWFDNVSLVQRVKTQDRRLTGGLSITSLDSYRHAITASGGFDTATVGFKDAVDVMADWLISGLGKHLVVKDRGGNHIWEGFVNEVKVQVGATTVSVGPITDMANRGRILYKSVDWDTKVPIKGDAVKSIWINNDESQKKYGVLEGTFSGGEGDVDEATQVLGSVVAETSWPEVSHTLGLGSGSISITLECKGFQHMLGKYYYYRTGEAGKMTISAKLQAILDASPNYYLDPDYTNIEANTSEVAVYEDEDKTALALIKELVTFGDASFNRFIWGVYENGTFVYKMQTEEIEYERNASDGVIFEHGAELNPWNVRPGKWMRTSELIEGHLANVTVFRSDPTLQFVETVSYTAPYGLSLSGAKLGKFKQRLERLGLVE